MSGLFFTKRHEWVLLDESTAAIGLTGAGLTGDVVFIELPDIGRRVETGEACALVETTKTVSEVHAPVAGTVAEVNDSVFDDPDMISREPMNTWLFRLHAIGNADIEELLTEQDYAGWKQG